MGFEVRLHDPIEFMKFCIEELPHKTQTLDKISLGSLAPPYRPQAI